MSILSANTRDFRDLFAKKVRFDDFSEGDFSDPDLNRSGIEQMEKAGYLGLGGWYIYRGMRGAGFYPLSAKFWKNLETIRKANVDKFLNYGYRRHLGAMNKASAEALIGRITRSGFGLRTAEEGITSLFSRSIAEIPEFLRYLGFDEAAKKLKIIPEKILGGDPSSLLGFSKLPPEVRAKMIKGGFKPGARTMAALGKGVGKKLLLPVIGGIAALRVLDEGIKGAGEKGGLGAIVATPLVEARKAAQTVLSGVGVTGVHERLEETLPGYLRVAGLVGGTVWGVKGTRKLDFAKMSGGKGFGRANKFMAIALRAFIGGVAGMVAENFLDKSPEELEKIYSGEQEVPVRSGRWWMFGRTPYEGGKIKRFKKHWYAEMMAGGGELPEAEGAGELRKQETQEWIEASVAPRKSFEDRAAASLGLKEMRVAPVTDVAGPLDPRVIASETIYRGTEFMGLPGFVLQGMLESATGSTSGFNPPRQAGPGLFGDPTAAYWDKEMGGMLGANEVFRRFLPPRRADVDYYTPVPGRSNEWRPVSSFGTMYKRSAGVSRGGYASDLSQVSPEERASQRKRMMEQYQFYPERSTMRDTIEEQLTQENEKIKETGFATKTWLGGMGKLGALPVPGVSWIMDKILPYRSALEHYKKFQIYSKESADWGKPIEDFVVPYINMARGLMDPSYVPQEVKKRWDIEEYFDKLKYVKYNLLSQAAKQRGDEELASAFLGKSKTTMAGIDPYGDPAAIMRAIPKRERPYFESFLSAPESEREEILKISPDYMKEIYEAQWSKGSDRSKIISDMFNGLEMQIGRERGPVTPVEELNEYFSKKHLPGKRWAGWHPSVDLEDVKLKVVKNEAMDIHDFSLWESQEREMKRKRVPFIDAYDRPNIRQLNPYMRRLLLEQMFGMGMTSPQIDISYIPSDYDGVDLDFDVSRDMSDMYVNSAGAMV